MGLAGRKEKQRFGIDPQNKQWQSDKEAFGFKLLSKMGWEEGKGLGKDLSGMNENIKLKLKNNNYGIGATAKTSDNWLESSFGFDDLLKGMNSSSNGKQQDHSNYVAAEASAGDNEEDDTSSVLLIIPTSTQEETDVQGADKPMKGRHAHRKKFIQNKSVSSFERHQINNILGKTRTGDIQHPIESDTVMPLAGEKSNDSAVVVEMNQVIPTVVKPLSVNDYFAQKMAAKGLTMAGMLSGIPDQVAPMHHQDVSTSHMESDQDVVKVSSSDDSVLESSSATAVVPSNDSDRPIAKKSKKEKKSKKRERDDNESASKKKKAKKEKK